MELGQVSTIRDEEWKAIRALYLIAAKKALKLAEASWKSEGAPTARVFEVHPIFGYGVGVDLEWSGPDSRDLLPEPERKYIEGEA
jgi:hypothetical protein